MKQKLKGFAYLLSMSCGLCICFVALIPWIALLPVKFKPIQEFRKIYRVFLNGLYFSYASSLTHLLCQTTVVLHYNEEDNVLNNNRSVLMCNHRSRVDIVYAGWSLGAFQQTFPYIVVMLKDDLKKIPIFGWCMQMIMYIFLSRRRDTDIPNIKRMLNYWISQNIDFWLFLFPEGTDLSESRKKENNECSFIHYFKGFILHCLLLIRRPF
jgi:1-acyl-sn-glycerol-3-phosphate acyltransferase